ncbi:MAG: hypothetical protein ACJA0J_001035 [Bdellovibrionota bacterium]
MLTAGEAKNVDNAVVLARLFNEASGQKAPSKKHGLFISRPLTVMIFTGWPIRPKTRLFEALLLYPFPGTRVRALKKPPFFTPPPSEQKIGDQQNTGPAR